MKEGLEKILKELRTYGIENNVPNITDDNAAFLQDILRKEKSKNVLEIGTANGYSTICLGSVLAEQGGHITSIEFSILSHEQAKDNIKKAGLEEYTTLIHGQALDIIPGLDDDSYDFIFIDGMKRRSKDFLELCWPKAKDGATIIIDDVIKFKEKMVGLYEYVEEKGMDHEVIQIDPDDGIMVIRK